jgi:hypothetical protein
MPIEVLMLYTGLDQERIRICFELFGDKATYVDNWIIIKNYGNYNPMRNDSISKISANTNKKLPKKIRKYLIHLTPFQRVYTHQ